jgi:hypothetical protein
MSKLADMLRRRDVGVSVADVDRAEQAFGHRLPDDLREFWLISNGSEWTEFPAMGIAVLSLEDARSLWELPETDRSGPQRLIDIASDGSRERFCLDPTSGKIVFLDIVGDEPPVECASSLTELVEKLATGWDPFDLVV